MREKPIAVGDLVQVVRPTLCCDNSRSVGVVRKVIDGIRASLGHCRCGDIRPQTDADFVTLDNGNSCERVRLKRIPPLSELEGERTEEQLREPA